MMNANNDDEPHACPSISRQRVPEQAVDLRDTTYVWMGLACTACGHGASLGAHSGSSKQYKHEEHL